MGVSLTSMREGFAVTIPRESTTVNPADLADETIDTVRRWLSESADVAPTSRPNVLPAC